MNKETVVRVGPGPLFLLFVVFLVLKLTEAIDWSWWWVTAPLWAIPALIGGFVLSVFSVVWIAAIFGGGKLRIKRN